MKKLLFLFMLLPAACRQEPPPDPLEPCILDNWGHVRIQNYSDDRYIIMLDNGITVTVDANAYTNVEHISARTYRVRWTNERTGNVGEINDFVVDACETALIPIIY